MITYLFPGYIALATWTGERYSEPVPVGLWQEFRLSPSHEVKCTIRATRTHDPYEDWSCRLTVNRGGKPDKLLYITFFGDGGQVLYRYDGPGLIFEPIEGAEIICHMGGQR